MISFFNFLNNYFVKLNDHFYDHFHGNERFSTIFFDKFKNLLDDYIVNYQIKYFFYVLFMSFFYLELSEGIYQLVHNYSSFHLSICGSFLIDICNSLFDFAFFEFLYSFFAFNLDLISLFFHLVCWGMKEKFYGTILLCMIAFSIIEAFDYLKSKFNIIFLFFIFFICSLSFFLLFRIGILDIDFCLVYSLVFPICYFMWRNDFTKLDLVLMFFIYILPNLFNPMNSFFLMNPIITIFFFFAYIEKHMIAEEDTNVIDNKLSFYLLCDYLLVTMAAFYAIHLPLSVYNTTIYIVTLFSIYYYLLYILRKD